MFCFRIPVEWWVLGFLWNGGKAYGVGSDHVAQLHPVPPLHGNGAGPQQHAHDLAADGAGGIGIAVMVYGQAHRLRMMEPVESESPSWFTARRTACA